MEIKRETTTNTLIEKGKEYFQTNLLFRLQINLHYPLATNVEIK